MIITVTIKDQDSDTGEVTLVGDGACVDEKCDSCDTGSPTGNVYRFVTDVNRDEVYYHLDCLTEDSDLVILSVVN